MAKPLVIVESPPRPAPSRASSAMTTSSSPPSATSATCPTAPPTCPPPTRASPGPAWASTSTTTSSRSTSSPPEKKDQVRHLKQRLKDADELYLATDEDREGEAIAWHLLEVLSPAVPVKRMVFHEITPEAIRAGHRRAPRPRPPPGRRPGGPPHPRPPLRLRGQPGPLEEGHAPASPPAGCRASPPASWSSASGPACAFRAAVVLGPRRHLRARAADGRWPDRSSATLVALDGTRLATGKDFDEHGQLPGDVVVPRRGRRRRARRRRSRTGRSRSARSSASPTRRRPYRAVHDLDPPAGGGPQAAASPSARTMRSAQRLYENGYITYMRTDSTTLSETALAAARSSDRASATARTTCPTRPATTPARSRTPRRPTRPSAPPATAFRAPGRGARASSAPTSAASTS